MNVRTYILIVLILLASGEYFTGRMDRIPRMEGKAYMDLGKPGNLTERSWMEDPGLDFTLDLFATEYSGIIYAKPGIHITDSFETGLIHVSQLDPLLLDRPPPTRL